jgi:dTDP-4-dehydrorhamnose 3,5-epimerase
MNVIRTSIPDVLILESEVFEDHRGFFYESFNRRTFAEVTGLDVDFVQDNHTRSVKNVLRGLHYQVRQPQGKLVRVVAGEVFDVAVDIRRSSPAFGKWTGSFLSAANRRMEWIPPGFAHGFVVTSDFAELLYKTTNYWASEYERCIAWDDPDIAIDWPLQGVPVLSDKDKRCQCLRAAEVYP